jgi:preprotein translocase subunit YajC
MNSIILASAAGQTGTLILWLVVMVAIMYFLMIRPQRKEQKRVSAMLNDMAVGDSVVTTSGFYGVILDISDDDVIVEFGNNKNCRIPMRKSAIAEVEKAGAAFEAPADKKDSDVKVNGKKTK